MEQIEYIKCNYCGNDDSHLFLTENGFDLKKCKRCGLLYVNPRPASNDEFKKYSHIYTDYVDKYVENCGIYLAEAKERIDEIEKWKCPGKLLDIGCAAGIFLNYGRERGWDSYGIEPDGQLAQYARSNFRLRVEECDFLNNKYDNNAFDVVTAHNIISHVSDPERFFCEVHRVLKDGGLFVMHTGNNAELCCKRDGEVLGERWSTPDHLFHFSQALLVNYLKRNKLHIEKAAKIHLIRFLFAEDNLRVSKGSFLKDLLKRMLIYCPSLKDVIETIFIIYFRDLRKNNISKLCIVARKVAA
jgi:SAM-dependent methyltransferase